MSEALLGALALLLIFEGLLPLVNPRGWRSVLQRIAQLNDGQVRFIGLTTVGLGLVLLWAWT